MDSETLARVNARVLLYQDLAGLHDWLENASYDMDEDGQAWLERCLAWLDKEVEFLRQ